MTGEARMIEYLRELSVLQDIVGAYTSLSDEKMLLLERYLKLSKEVVERRSQAKVTPSFKTCVQEKNAHKRIR